MDTITAIKKALEGVTPGPWGYVASNENHGPYVCNDWGAGDICDGYVMSKPDSLSIRNGGDSKPINHQHDEADANMRYIASVNPAAITELLSTLESLQRENEDLKQIVFKVNDIRNSIIGCQTVNWSEHIYPLVSALEDGGIRGMGYPAAREIMGTLIERTNAAEAEVKHYRAALSEIATNEEYRILTAEEAQTVAQKALASTGDTHGN